VSAAARGLAGATPCNENSVPTPAEVHRDPAVGAWRGIEGAKSATITVLI
jgi:hypothetical protein